MLLRTRFAAAVLPALVGFAFGVGTASTPFAPADSTPAPRAPAAFKRDAPENRGLDANLYMETSAEYRACCLQAYRWGAIQLKQGLELPRNEEKPPAVVMDLDETVLDNAGFQAMLLRSALAYDDRLWDYWQEKLGNEVALIPGAYQFIQECGQLKVEVVYISNRDEKYRNQTRNILARLGLGEADEHHLKLATTTSNKTQRRKEAEERYSVLMYFGDNLRDFDESFRFDDLAPLNAAGLEIAIRERKKKVDAQADAWGSKWIILPNPAYGEWMKPLGRGAEDLDRLVPAIPPKP